MKVAVISVSNIYLTPYYYKYEKILCHENNGFDLIYWNRDLMDEKVGDKVSLISYDKKSTYNDNNYIKIVAFWGFYRFVLDMIKKNKYDKLIFLGTYSLLTFFLEPYLSKEYKGRYWVDIRDYTYEHIKWFYLREKRLIENAQWCYISSEGYKEFLPEHDYQMVHNADMKVIEQCLNSTSDGDKKEGPIRISFIGNVRYLEENEKLIRCFMNDKRFLLQYFGGGSEKMADLATELGARNVVCYGRFPHERTHEFYGVTDIINNLYGNSGIELRTALSNKLYFSIALNKPILVCPNTYMEKVSMENGVGYVINWADSNIPDKLYDWYHNVFLLSDIKSDFMVQVKKDEADFVKNLIRFVGEK